MSLHNDRTVSVVIPCFNAKRFIKDAIESVLSQTVLPKEILVIDDGSVDGSGNIAQGVSQLVRVIRQENRGAGFARNRGMDEASGDWIAFLDADDVWHSQKLELQLSAIPKSSNIVCVHTDRYTFKHKDEPILRSTPAALLAKDYRIEIQLLTCLVHPSTAMVRRNVQLRFPHWAPHAEDVLFFAELSLSGDFLYIDQPLVGYRLHPGQKTRRIDSWSSDFLVRFRWIDEKKNQIGAQRAENLRHLLRQQIVEWLNLARWNRQWDTYHDLKKYAQSLEWPEGRPEVLDERLYPKFIYSVKDVIDKLFK